MKAKVEGMPELLKNLDSFKNEAAQVIVKAVFNGCRLIMNEAKMTEAFKDRSGLLRKSIQALEPEVTEDKIIGEVEAGMEYAAFVELGTMKSRPRPFLFPALELLSPSINTEIINLIKQIKWVNS